MKFSHGTHVNTFKIKGDPKNPEKAQTILLFPGGALELTRTSDNEYWAHIMVNSEGQVDPDIGYVNTKGGKVVDARLDYNFENPPREQEIIPDLDKLKHIAIKITTDPTPRRG